MAKKLFTTIYGRNLVGELKNIVQRPYLVVTMEDLWAVSYTHLDVYKRQPYGRRRRTGPKD